MERGWEGEDDDDDPSWTVGKRRKAWMPPRRLIEIFAVFGRWNQGGALVAQCSAQILCPTIRGVISDVSHSYE